MLQLYTVFHLNLGYSSIEEEQRPEVVRRCYWPLLRLARAYGLPFGIEATGFTLETAATIDPAWVAELRSLCVDGPCEFVGSGYAQVIGPLVPAEVVAANLRLGHQVYERLLGLRPRIALVNEQAYSAGLIRHYLDAGYRALVMEWDNPARSQPNWDPEWRYFAQVASGPHGAEIALIWNKSIAFQKFQRYAHGEMELDDYLTYLKGHLGGGPRAFPLYGNDVEVFDFRPGRYHTEAPLHEGGEWQRLEKFFEALRNDGQFTFLRPSQVLELDGGSSAGNRLRLESAAQPIPVKKQGKYNITRWAVTGRDDVGINSACWRIYESLRKDDAAGDEAWRELCHLWSSDFRTHITEKRWTAYQHRLRAAEGLLHGGSADHWRLSEPPLNATRANAVRDGAFLTIDTETARLRLNCRRGLAIDALTFKTMGDVPLCGTLRHGYYDDINWGADYYTGHLVLEAPGRPKVTDLNPVEPEVFTDPATGTVHVHGTVATPLGLLHKHLELSVNPPRLTITYRPEWKRVPAGSLRLGYVTLFPEAWDRSSLFFATHNGGADLETFPVGDETIEHGAPVSFLVSASQGLGMTGGHVLLGDRRCHLRVEVSHATAALLGLVTFRTIGEKFFFRLGLSAGEMDETLRTPPEGRDPHGRVYTLALLPGANGC